VNDLCGQTDLGLKNVQTVPPGIPLEVVAKRSEALARETHRYHAKRTRCVSTAWDIITHDGLAWAREWNPGGNRFP